MALEISETPGRPYKINLPTFEGPLDLLLYLIRKDELDIWDIPISRITDEYLTHLELMQELNLDIAGEFLLMAATLTTLKSRMLLPSETGKPLEEVEDPRTELVERLLEYQRYREAAEGLSKRVVLNRDVFERGQTAVKLPEGTPVILPEVSLFELMSALQDVLGRAQARGYIHTVSAERFSVVERIHWLHDHVRLSGPVSFRGMFSEIHDKMDIVLTFLALLEMLKANILTLELDVSRLPEQVRRRLAGEPEAEDGSGAGPRFKLPVAEGRDVRIQADGSVQIPLSAGPAETSLLEDDGDELLDEGLELDEDEPLEPDVEPLLDGGTGTAVGAAASPALTEVALAPLPSSWEADLDAHLDEELRTVTHRPLAPGRRRRRAPPPEAPLVLINDLDWIVKERHPGVELLMDWRGIE